jgi:integrase
MEKRFVKLPKGKTIDDLRISKRNREFINKLLSHLQGHVCPARLVKYKHATTRFAHLVGKDFDKMTYEDIRQAGGIINQSPFATKTKQDVISEVRAAFKFWFGDNEHFPRVVSGLRPPPSKSKLKLPQDMPTENDIYRMIKATRNSRDAFLIAFMGLDGGVRPVEIRRMKWEDIRARKTGQVRLLTI